MKEMVDKWRSLAITEKEEEVIGVGDDLVLKGKEKSPKALVGKLLSCRPYNKRHFKETIANLWKIVGGFEIREIEEDIYLFIIKDDKEIERILSMEP
ncbi:hypothetical protein TIFTF001_033964 [Ficus carica]|uniref:DUF4283 domain-containing protein n=1 Tax=Ficus carica TaxID=3494 RepID=A0AA88E6B1_FICCA|nr:hypothetical protein TIFTF001_033964 [Ficus carica]